MDHMEDGYVIVLRGLPHLQLSVVFGLRLPITLSPNSLMPLRTNEDGPHHCWILLSYSRSATGLRLFEMERVRCLQVLRMNSLAVFLYPFSVFRLLFGIRQSIGSVQSASHPSTEL